MTKESDTWALALSAGEGGRLRALRTAASGAFVPKQFCSLYEGPSLLHATLCRARTVATEDRICLVASDQHRRWWKAAPWLLPPENVIVEAENGCTGLGIVLPLLHIPSQTPEARFVLFPSDHPVRNAAVLSAALQGALEHLAEHPGDIVLLGASPEELDPGLGYIVPGPVDERGVLMIERIVEKPSLTLANELARAGGFWNISIVVSTRLALIDRVRERFPEIVSVMTDAFEPGRREGSEETAIAELYQKLPAVEFSRDILTEQVPGLRVRPLQPCGWSDLGTSKRVAATPRGGPRPVGDTSKRVSAGYLSLTDQYARTRARDGAAMRPVGPR